MALPVVKVNIRNIAFGGDGVGEVTEQSDGNDDLLGITAFVPYSAPGEVVSAQVEERKQRYIKTSLVDIELAADGRKTPECKYYTVCGGCDLQHIGYRSQLEMKKEMIAGALRSARFERTIVDRLDDVEPSEEYGYRRRVSLHIDSNGKIGFYRANSRATVEIEKCAIAVPEINQTIEHIQDFARRVAGKISSVLLEADDEGVVAVLRSPYDLGRLEQQDVIAAAKEIFSNAVLFVGEKSVGGYGREILELPLNESKTLSLRVPAGDFSQVNSEMNRRLVEAVLEDAELFKGANVLDLYSGAGNFAIPLAKNGASVTAVEVNQRLVTFGRENASRYGLQKDVEFVPTSVERFLKKRGRKAEADLVIADPPRSGLGQLVGELGSAKRLMLISCHLPSFVRDLRGILDNGWELEAIKPFDMFAQTTYVEILSVFRARS